MNMTKNYRLSVVIPTYNCEALIRRHITSIQKWQDLADEIVIVDSQSVDGTINIIKEKLRHPNLRVIEREPGLYESWNEAISVTTGKWIYISTVGDIISRQHLETLIHAGEVHKSDVIISPQRFVDCDGSPLLNASFKNPKIYRDLKGSKIALLQPSAVQFYAFECGKPNALLGSVAGDLFGGNHLRARPFPVHYGTHGDTAWVLKYAKETSICLLAEGGSDFCLHAKGDAPSEPISTTLHRMYQDEVAKNNARESSPHYRFLLRKVAELWHEKKSCSKRHWVSKISKTFVYLYFRWQLAHEESGMRRQIKREAVFGGA